LGVAGAIESSSADQSTPSTRRGTRHHVRLVAGHGRRHHRDPLRRHSRVGRVVSRVRFLAGLLCQSWRKIWALERSPIVSDWEEDSDRVECADRRDDDRRGGSQGI